jgi:predicted transposase/invertase (TIGR01784 family)
MEAYNKSILEYSDIRDAVKYVGEEAREEGLRRGLRRGLKRGREEGLRRGREEGREEGEKRKVVEFAIKCLNKGMSVVAVAELTDLSIEEVKEIMNSE